MAASQKRTIVAGSEKKALPHAKVTGALDPNERIEVTVILRPRSGAGSRTAKAAANQAMTQALALPERRAYLTRETFAAARGAAPDDVEKVESFARDHNLTVVEASIAKRSIRLTGTIQDLTAAFRPNLKQAKLGARTVRTRTGGISVPQSLAPIVVAVLGFDNRPAASPHIRFLGGPGAVRAPKNGARAAGSGNGAARRAVARNAPNGSFTPPQVAKLYNFPAGLDGSGQCIAIVELNDFDANAAGVPHPISTGFSLTDLKAYFTSLGLRTPDVTAVGVASDGGVGANLPGPDPNADGEVMLDIEVAGAVAPGAQIAVYLGLNTDNGFLASVNTALHDNVRKPSVISISWGSTEDLNTVQALNAFDLVLQDAAALGVTVCCSSGDDGSSDIRKPSERDGKPHVDFPASSPFALACGGTKLLGSWRDDCERGGVESGQWWNRRRSEQSFWPAALSSENEGAEVTKGKGRARRTRRRGRRGPEYWLSSQAGRRPERGHRRYQRGVTALGRLDRARQSETRESREAPGRVRQSAAFQCSSGCRRLSRHRVREQRHRGDREVPGREGLGRLHGAWHS